MRKQYDRTFFGFGTMRMMGVVMDRFGRNVVAIKEDDDHFRITVPIAVREQLYGWV